MGPISISTSDTNNNNSNNKCDELSNVPTSLHTSYSSSTLPPYSELVKELGTL